MFAELQRQICVVWHIYLENPDFQHPEVIRATGIVDEVYWGKVTFLKPETARGFLFMGVCFNCSWARKDRPTCAC